MTTATKERKKARTGGTTLPTDSLKRALGEVAAAVPSRHAKPVLSNVLLSNGGCTATDLELQVSAALPWAGDKVLLPYARLRAIVSECRADEVSITVDGTVAEIKAGSGTWRLPVEDAAEFPTWQPDATTFIRIPCDQFVRAVRSVVYATDDESSRYALGAVLLEVKDNTLTLVATDGRRLACVELEPAEEQAVDDRTVLVPSHALATMASIAAGHPDSAVQLDATTNEVVATIDGSIITARQIDGRFPRWRDVFPKREAKASIVNIGELLSATRAAAIVATENSKGITYAFSADGIWLHGQSAESGESSVTCNIVSFGQAATTKLDPLFVRQFLQALPADGEPEVEIEIVDHDSAVVLKSGDVRGVIMPLAKDA